MSRSSASLRAADWLSLAAAPVLALMALLTAATGDARAGALCSQADHHSLLTGMAPMYLLMAAAHLAPWLRLRVLRS